MTTVTITAPSAIDLSGQRLVTGDPGSVFIAKITDTQTTLEQFSTQLGTFVSDLQQAVVVIDGIASNSATVAANAVQATLQGLVEQATTLKNAADTASGTAQEFASNAKAEADRAAALAAGFGLPATPVALSILVQKSDASGFEYRLFDWSALPGRPEPVVVISAGSSVIAGHSSYYITGDHIITLPAAADSSPGDQIRLTKSVDARPVIQAVAGEQITVDAQSDQSIVFDVDAELVLIFDNGWRL